MPKKKTFKFKSRFFINFGIKSSVSDREGHERGGSFSTKLGMVRQGKQT